MKSNARLIALCVLAAAPAGAQEIPAAPGAETPQGRSGDARFDQVVRAVVSAEEGVRVAVRGLASDTPVEVTAIDSGRVVAALTGAAEDAPSVSPMLAASLGVSGSEAAIRVRPAVLMPQERAALSAGVAPPARMPAPPALIAALAKQVPAPAVVASVPPASSTAPRTERPSRIPRPVAAPEPVFTPKPFVPGPVVAPTRAAPAQPKAAPKPMTKPATAPAARGGWVVQVATLSSAARAATLARSLDGFTQPAGALVRVRMGPFATSAEAGKARARAAAKGYGDATVLRND